MGQKPSRPTEQQTHTRKEDVFALTSAELRELLAERPIISTEIQSIAKSLSSHGSYSTTDLNGSSSAFYSVDGDSPQVKLAFKLNEASDDLARLRFQLVPGKIKEPIFWEAVISVVKERLVEKNAAWQLFQEKGNGHHPIQEKMVDSMQPLGRNAKTKMIESFPDDETDDEAIAMGSFSAQLAKKDKQIESLQRKVHELTRLFKGAKESQNHNGEWIMDDESRAFLGYPDDVKENMRKEKQRRLKQVTRIGLSILMDTGAVAPTRNISRLRAPVQSDRTTNLGSTIRRGIFTAA